MYKVNAIGILGQVLATKTFDHKPSFSEINRFLNRVSIKYGAHPGHQTIQVNV